MECIQLIIGVPGFQDLRFQLLEEVPESLILVVFIGIDIVVAMVVALHVKRIRRCYSLSGIHFSVR